MKPFFKKLLSLTLCIVTLSSYSLSTFASYEPFTSNEIINVYDKPTYNSTKATYDMKFNVGIGDFTIVSSSGWLRAEIIGNKLVTSIR